MSGRRGLTLVEVLVATGLAALLLVALVSLVETSLGVWGRTETRRDLLERATSISELVATDLVATEGGRRGDLLADWASFDTDGDGIAGSFAQRVRLVRRVSAAELSRFGVRARDARRLDGRAGAEAGALLEVCWYLRPGEVGTLLRGERLVVGDEANSFFADGFFDAAGNPPESTAFPVSEEVLWFALGFASRTSDLADGWSFGEELEDCGYAWDARTSARTDSELTFLNGTPAGCPAARDLPVFPRRVRLELEIERRADLARRTTLTEPAGPAATTLTVRDERFTPPEGGWARLGEEWVRVTRVDGRRLTVERGARGSRAIDHDAGTLVHYGHRTVREVRLPAYREDWNL